MNQERKPDTTERERYRKPGIRIPPNILTIIIAIIAVVATIFGWGMKFMAMQKDMSTMERRLIIVEAERSDYTESLHNIELHLAGIDEKMKTIEKFMEKNQ